MAQVLFSPKGVIKKSDKDKLFKEGYLVIEVDNPSSIKSISDIPHVGTNEIVEAALTCVAHKDMPSFLKSWLSDTMVTIALNKIKDTKSNKSTK